MRRRGKNEAENPNLLQRTSALSMSPQDLEPMLILESPARTGFDHSPVLRQRVSAKCRVPYATELPVARTSIYCCLLPHNRRRR